MNLGKIATIVLVGCVLASCNSTESALKVDDAKPGGNATAANSPPIAPTTGAQSAAVGSTRLQFAPIIGAPVEKVTPLSRELTAAAKARGLTIVPSADTSPSQILKGYFSLLNENGQVTVVYVFDVLDSSGNRLHRIQGQESTAASSATASWESVPDAVMVKIADATIASFIAWRGGAA
jgi:ABC-type uncharacterized transport system substrate-binding protein